MFVSPAPCPMQTLAVILHSRGRLSDLCSLGKPVYWPRSPQPPSYSAQVNPVIGAFAGHCAGNASNTGRETWPDGNDTHYTYCSGQLELGRLESIPRRSQQFTKALQLVDCPNLGAVLDHLLRIRHSNMPTCLWTFSATSISSCSKLDLVKHSQRLGWQCSYRLNAMHDGCTCGLASCGSCAQGD